jgi:hypothetical protein
MPGRALALGTLLLAGCGTESAQCAGVQGYGLVIEVVDANTGATLCDASVKLEAESHHESLSSDGLDPCRYLGATTPGNYTIEVRRSGYETGGLEVQVEPAATCSGLDTRELSVELTPTS